MELEVVKTQYRAKMVAFEMAQQTNRSQEELRTIYRQLKELQYRIIQSEIRQAKRRGAGQA
jgi:hypothetical protein